VRRTCLSSPGLTGRPSIPEAVMIESRERGVLGRPVKCLDRRHSRAGDDSLVVGREYCAVTRLQHSRLLLHLLDQLLADHHVAAGNEEDHGRCASEGQNENARVERRWRCKMAAEISAELRDQPFERCQRTLTMSGCRRRPEVAGRRSNRRFCDPARR